MEEAMNSAPMPDLRASRASANPDPRRWLILGIVGLAQLMVVLDRTCDVSTSL